MVITALISFIGMGAVLYTKFLALAGIGPLFADLADSWALQPVLLVIAATVIYPTRRSRAPKVAGNIARAV